MSIHKEKLIIGRADVVDLPALGIFDLKAKIDTGAYTSALHCDKIEIIEENGIKMLYFEIPESEQKAFRTQDYEQKIIKSSFGELEKRFIIKSNIILFKRKIKTSFSLTDRGNMRYPLLIGRKLLRGKFLVDVGQVDLSYNSKKKHS